LAAGIPVRVGAQTPETEPLLTHVYDVPPDEHAARTALALARLTVTALRATPSEVGHVAQFTLTRDSEAEADALLTALHGKRLVALHPSAGAPLKSWPADRWAALADALASNGVTVLLTGAPADRELLDTIQQGVDGCLAVLCGQSLELSAALFAHCDVVVTVDSGAGHLGAAVGTPTVRLYGPAAPAIFGPWPPSNSQRVLITKKLDCVPCGNLQSPPCGARTTPACMLAIGVDEVLNAVRVQLDRG
jgi:ADP-heptose:LPS heptosyltransferase